MEKEFIQYEQALALKELGFDEPCFGYYLQGIFHLDFNLRTNSYFSSSPMKDYFSAPTFSQTFRFFREKYGLDHDISKNEKVMIDYVASKHVKCLSKYRYGYTDTEYHSVGTTMEYDEAELECLKKLIEIAKNI